jgi:hypothetical protein
LKPYAVFLMLAIAMVSRAGAADRFAGLRHDLETGRVDHMQVYRASGAGVGLRTTEQLRLFSDYTCTVDLTGVERESVLAALNATEYQDRSKEFDAGWGVDFLDAKNEILHSLYMDVEWRDSHKVDGSFDTVRMTLNNSLLRWLEQRQPHWRCVTRKI